MALSLLSYQTCEALYARRRKGRAYKYLSRCVDLYKDFDGSYYVRHYRSTIVRIFPDDTMQLFAAETSMSTRRHISALTGTQVCARFNPRQKYNVFVNGHLFFDGIRVRNRRVIGEDQLRQVKYVASKEGARKWRELIRALTDELMVRYELGEFDSAAFGGYGRAPIGSLMQVMLSLARNGRLNAKDVAAIGMFRDPEHPVPFREALETQVGCKRWEWIVSNGYREEVEM